MYNITIRTAIESDRKEIAKTFAESFYNDWKSFSDDVDKISRALENGINIKHYLVAILDNEIVAFLAFVTGNNRAFGIPIKEFQKEFGYFKGFMGGMTIKNDFEKSLELPDTTCYIDIVGVKKAIYEKWYCQ
ncbi:hypothetical protein [[Clostridium] dakarense]|uniref:hypothetical protein n=1 Tax=Faecalimicrobium dakarense TaxID=1301100 RepID=UPI0004BA54F6|nr:hypothetical protein [[Clostridium] dakarense]